MTFTQRIWRGCCVAAASTMLLACGSGPAVVSIEQMAKPRVAPAELTELSDEQLQAKRDALAAEQGAASAQFVQAEVDCWKRFAVTPCINAAAQKRRGTVDQLRADDIVLADEQRKRRLQRADERLNNKQVTQ